MFVFYIGQVCGISRHTGCESCFYRVWQQDEWKIQDAVLKDEKEIYGHAHLYGGLIVN